MYKTDQKGIYRKVTDYFLRTCLAAVIVLTPNMATARNSKTPPIKRDGIENILNAVGGYLEKADNYPTLDKLSREKNLNLRTGLEYTTLLPGCYILAVAKPVKGLVVDAPQEAMRRAKAMKSKEGRSVREYLAEAGILASTTQSKGITESKNPSNKDSEGLFEGLLGLFGDITGPVTQYAAVVSEGILEYIIEGGRYIITNPGDFGVKSGTAIVIGKAWSDAAHRRGHSIKVLGEELPPEQPEFPGGGPSVPGVGGD